MKMSLYEWWRIYEIKRPRDKNNDYAGSITEKDAEMYLKMIEDYENTGRF